MKKRQIKAIETPYQGISEGEYQIEKRRLQLELLKIQQALIANNQRLVVSFDGRDAAGKGSTIKRFTEYLIPAHVETVSLGIPTPEESKQWFRRYRGRFPDAGQIVFFDRSWYNRALIEPTMGYCSEAQYRYFMKKVLNWEHKLINEGFLLVKFYLSVDAETQLYRFQDRLTNPLTYWKFSKNDLEARKKWQVFTHYKEQMFEHTSSEKSPWVVINSNKKREARLTAMLYLVRLFAERKFEVLSGEDIQKNYQVSLDGVPFRGLNPRQLAVLKDLSERSK